MIEDKELRDLFRIESSEHIQKLEDGLMRLEKEPHNQAILEEVFREAHSLKGAARMLGLTEIETISHRLEDTFGSARKGSAAVTPETIDVTYKILDDVKRLVHEAITGEAPVAELGLRIAEVKEGTKEAEEKAKIPPSPPFVKGGMGGVGEFKIDTVRVDTRRLDALMTQVGELTVTKLRVAQRLSDIDEIIELWEKLKSDNYLLRTSEIMTPPSPPLKIRGGREGLRGGEWELKSEFEGLLNKLKKEAYEDSSRLDFVVSEIEDGVRTIRLLPLSTVFSLFPRMVRDMAREKSKEVSLVIEGGDTTADKRIIEEMKDPLMHMIRNAIDHGIETPDERENKGKLRTGTICLSAYQTAANIVIEVKDDGCGLDIEKIKGSAVKRKIYREEDFASMTPAQIQSLIFVSGISTSAFVTDVSGRGVGLDVVRTNVERLKGSIQVESSPGGGSVFRVQLPITLATARVLIFEVNGFSYAMPVENIHSSRFVSKDEIFTIEGRETIVFDGQPVSVARLSELLEIGSREVQLPSYPLFVKEGKPQGRGVIKRGREGAFPCIIISIGDDKLGVIVDELLDEQEIVLKTQSAILKRVRNVSGATILGTGDVCMVLNPQDMIKTVRRREAQVPVERPVEEVERKKIVLLVEDSITTRTQERRILTGSGYEVVEAVDGVDAFNKLGSRSFDAVVADILMPNMDGLTLTAKIREDKRYKEMPVILVTSLASDEDRRKGLEAGANAYIPKPAFDQQVLLETLRRLV